MKRACLFLVLLFAAQTSTYAITFAQLALGGGYEAILFISNKSPLPWKGEIRPFQGQNLKWSGAWSINGQSFTGKDGASFNLDGRATIKLTIRGDSTTRSGYLDLNGTGSSSSYQVAISYFYAYYSVSGELLDTVGSKESSASKKFYFPAEVTSSIDTGIAWCPWLRFTNETFPIIVSAFDETGNLVAQRTVSFAGHQAQFIGQLLSSLPKPFRGHIYLESLEYFTLEVLRLEQTASGFQLTSTPPDDYVP